MTGEGVRGRRSMEVTCGGRYWRKGERVVEGRIIGCGGRLSNKSTILSMKQVSQNSQDWRRAGGNMEEGV